MLYLHFYCRYRTHRYMQPCIVRLDIQRLSTGTGCSALEDIHYMFMSVQLDMCQSINFIVIVFSGEGDYCSEEACDLFISSEQPPSWRGTHPHSA